LEQDDARGKIALIDGMASPAAIRCATQDGAVGQIHISIHEQIHEMCISPVWGRPTYETREALPRTVVLSVSKADGKAWKARILEGRTVQTTLHAEVDACWRKIPLLVAERMPENMPDASVRAVLRAPRFLVLRRDGQRVGQCPHARSRSRLDRRAHALETRAEAVFLVRPFSREVRRIYLVRR
jgi:hypothetical protein